MDPYDEYSNEIDFNTGAEKPSEDDSYLNEYDSNDSYSNEYDNNSTENSNDYGASNYDQSSSNTSSDYSSNTFGGYSDQNISKLSNEDEELEKILSNRKARIKVVGCGGAGNNTIARISEIGVTGAEIVGINTDAQDLLNTTADKKILIGKDLTQGLGAGSDPQIGKDSAKESQKEIPDFIDENIFYLGQSYAFFWKNINFDPLFNGNNISNNHEYH